MKPYIGIVQLYIKAVFYKTLAAAAVMICAEIPMVLWASGKNGSPAEDIQKSGAFLALAAGLFLTFLIMCRSVYGKNTSARYTLERLKIRPWSMIPIQTVCNIMLYVIFLAVQILAVLLFILWYGRNVSDEIFQGQNTFVLFYQSGFLNGLIPLKNVNRMMQSASLILWQSFLAASAMQYGETGKSMYFVFVPAVAASLFFVRDLGEYAGAVCILVILHIMFVVSTLKSAWKKEKNDEKE